MRSFTTLLVVLASAGVVQSQLNQLPLPDFGNLTASAILGWYAWYTASRTIPDLVARFRDELARLRADSRDQRTAFREELAAERTQRHADQQATVEALLAVERRLSGSAVTGD